MHACMHAWPLGALITARIERSSIFCHATVAAAVVRTGYSIQNRKAEQLSFPSRYAKPVGQPVWLNSWLLGAAKSQYTSLVYSVHNLCTEKNPPQNRHWVQTQRRRPTMTSGSPPHSHVDTAQQRPRRPAHPRQVQARPSSTLAL